MLKECEDIRVSIIVPVYNSEKYLDECLRSIASQSLHEIEILCVDNASSDRSADIIHKYCLTDSRLTYIKNEKNMGLAYSRNVGLRKAKGTYVFFADSDDMLCEDALLTLYKQIEENNLDGVLFDAEVIDEKGNIVEGTYKACRSHLYSNVTNGEEMFSMLINDSEYTQAVWRQFWRKDFLLLHNICFFEIGAPHEDSLFSFEVLMAARRVKCIQEICYRYRRHSESVTSSINHERLAGMFICFVEILLRIRKMQLDTEIVDSIYICLSQYQRYINNMVNVLLRQGESLDVIDLKTSFYEIMFRLFIKQRNDIIGNYILQELIERRGLYKKLIVYGCGTFGKKLIQNLDKLNITDYAIAVTDKTVVKFEKPIYQIDELKKYRENGLVLIATSEIHQTSIIKILNELGFKHYLSVI